MKKIVLLFFYIIFLNTQNCWGIKWYYNPADQKWRQGGNIAINLSDLMRSEEALGRFELSLKAGETIKNYKPKTLPDEASNYSEKYGKGELYWDDSAKKWVYEIDIPEHGAHIRRWYFDPIFKKWYSSRDITRSLRGPSPESMTIKEIEAIKPSQLPELTRYDRDPVLYFSDRDKRWVYKYTQYIPGEPVKIRMPAPILPSPKVLSAVPNIKHIYYDPAYEKWFGELNPTVSLIEDEKRRDSLNERLRRTGQSIKDLKPTLESAFSISGNSDGELYWDNEIKRWVYEYEVEAAKPFASTPRMLPAAIGLPISRGPEVGRLYYDPASEKWFKSSSSRVNLWEASTKEQALQEKLRRTGQSIKDLKPTLEGDPFFSRYPGKLDWDDKVQRWVYEYTISPVSSAAAGSAPTETQIAATRSYPPPPTSHPFAKE